MEDSPKSSHEQTGRPLAIDHNARSASATEPAFISPPPGSPVYYGFPILSDVVVHGFTFGMITDFESEPAEGDAFVVAPDGSRAGLVWEVSANSYFEELSPLVRERWGVWGVSFPYANENARGRAPQSRGDPSAAKAEVGRVAHKTWR